MTPSALLIIDDHPVYRDALCEKLSQDFRPHQIAVTGVSDLTEAKNVLQKAIFVFSEKNLRSKSF